MTTKVIVPQEDLDKLEEVRKELYYMFKGHNNSVLIKLQRVTQPMWRVTHRKYPKVIRIGPLCLSLSPETSRNQ